MLKIDLVLLGLLMEQPRHGYDIKQEIDQRDMRNWVGISTPSIYNGLSRLERQGALEARKEPGGQHGDRTVYTITGQGRNLFQQNLQQAFTELEHPLFQILLGIGFAHLSDHKPLLESLETRRRGLESWREVLTQVKRNNIEAKQYPITSGFIIEYYERLLAMEADWLDMVREQIAGIENWPEGAFPK